MIDAEGVEHIVWTCMWCGKIIAFSWDDPGFAEDTRQYSGIIHMHCSFCRKVTVMEREIE